MWGIGLYTELGLVFMWSQRQSTPYINGGSTGICADVKASLQWSLQKDWLGFHVVLLANRSQVCEKICCALGDKIAVFWLCFGEVFAQYVKTKWWKVSAKIGTKRQCCAFVLMEFWQLVSTKLVQRLPYRLGQFYSVVALFLIVLTASQFLFGV